MGKRSTFTGYLRAQGATNASSSKLTGPTPGVIEFNVKVEFDATQASTELVDVWLPAGARVMSASSTGEGSAGTVDVGVTGTVAAFASGIAASTVVPAAVPGSLGGDVLAADVQLTAGDNTGGTGTAIVYLTVLMDDDGSRAN